MTRAATVVLALGVGLLLAPGCKKAGGQGGQVTAGGDEAGKTDVHLDLPNIPDFPKVATNPDAHSVTEMRRQGNKYLGQVVKIKGYVTWSYDCIDFFKKEFQAKAASEGKPLTEEEAFKKAQRQYCDRPPPKGEGHREKCDKPHFYIGDEPNASAEKSIWVVDVPRDPEGKTERDFAKEDPASWPPAPIYNVGDQVVVEGTWDTKSPKGFINLGGLLVYKSYTNVTTPEPPKPEEKCKGYRD